MNCGSFEEYLESEGLCKVTQSILSNIKENDMGSYQIRVSKTCLTSGSVSYWQIEKQQVTWHIFSCSKHHAVLVTVAGSRAYSVASTGDAIGRMSASIRSAIRCAGLRSWLTVQSAAYPSVTSLGRAWLTSRLVSEGGSISSRSATVMKQLRSPWNQN